MGFEDCAQEHECYGLRHDTRGGFTEICRFECLSALWCSIVNVAKICRSGFRLHFPFSQLRKNCRTGVNLGLVVYFW